MYFQSIRFIITVILAGRALAIPAAQKSSSVTAISEISTTKPWSYPLPNKTPSSRQHDSGIRHQKTGGKDSSDGSWEALSMAKRQAIPASGTCSFGTPACCAAGVAAWDPTRCTLGACDVNRKNMLAVCCVQTTEGLQCSAQQPFVANIVPIPSVSTSSFNVTDLTSSLHASSSVTSTDRGPSPAPSNPGAVARTTASPSMISSRAPSAPSTLLVKGSPCWADDQGVHC